MLELVGVKRERKRWGGFLWSEGKAGGSLLVSDGEWGDGVLSNKLSTFFFFPPQPQRKVKAEAERSQGGNRRTERANEVSERSEVGGDLDRAERGLPFKMG